VMIWKLLCIPQCFFSEFGNTDQGSTDISNICNCLGAKLVLGETGFEEFFFGLIFVRSVE